MMSLSQISEKSEAIQTQLSASYDPFLFNSYLHVVELADHSLDCVIGMIMSLQQSLKQKDTDNYNYRPMQFTNLINK
jgi:hypothetical protein